MMTAELKEKKRTTMGRMVKRESTTLRRTMMMRTMRTMRTMSTMRTMMMTTTKGTKNGTPIGKKVDSLARVKQ